MTTNYAYELQNPEGSEVKDAGILNLTGAAPLTPARLNQVSPVGTITSGALPTQQLVSTTAAQISLVRDVDTYTPVTFDATNNVASVAVALSPDGTTFSTVATPSLAAAVNTIGAIAILISLRVPAGWYVKMTTTHATLGVTTFA